MQRVHLIGIGGIGMSALARYYRSEGARVSGSDAARSEITDALRREGIRIQIGHRAANLPRGADRVVISAAVPERNPELRRARKLGVAVATYAEALGELTRRYRTIAIAGSHGKSTTTALVGLILAAAKFDPTVIVGTNLRELGGTNFRKGKGEWLVIEADEWNRSFHAYAPEIAVLTNVDREHLDTYKTYAGVVAGFARFLKNVRPGGAVVANGRDRGARDAVAAADLRPPTSDLRLIWYSRKPFQRHILGVPGAHNQENAEAAWQAAKLLRIKKGIVEEVFASYRGAWRRMERLQIAQRPSTQLRTGKARGVCAVIYTDYAHHPTEIRATLAAAREASPSRRIVAVFEPHQAERLTRLFREFSRAFGAADRAIILPVYRVRGRERSGREKTSRDLAAAIGSARAGNRTVPGYAAFAPSAAAAFRAIAGELTNPRAVLLFMSAGPLDAAVRRRFVKRL